MIDEIHLKEFKNLLHDNGVDPPYTLIFLNSKEKKVTTIQEIKTLEKSKSHYQESGLLSGLG